VDTLLAQNREVMPRAPKAVARNLRLENVNVEDPRLTALFAELLDEVT
jgi:hypothetical protein